ncbi:MAG TPA: hypothetical protein VH107_03625 [Lacipirellulaceae bacterium]|nr:hypothetical protein [Lacipirellulaceae bacterium]
MKQTQPSRTQVAQNRPRQQSQGKFRPAYVAQQPNQSSQSTQARVALHPTTNSNQTGSDNSRPAW